jgi:hypothetical protein
MPEQTAQPSPDILQIAKQGEVRARTVVGGSHWKALIAAARCFIGMSPWMVRYEKPAACSFAPKYWMVPLYCVKISALFV